MEVRSKGTKVRQKVLCFYINKQFYKRKYVKGSLVGWSLLLHSPSSFLNVFYILNVAFSAFRAVQGD